MKIFTLGEMHKICRMFFVGIVLLVCAVTAYLIFVVKNQTKDSIDWSSLTYASVSFDKDGVPTIEAKSWENLIRAQGFVHASERMWQMDLIRRSSAGTLSEFFGNAALDHDINRVKEDWLGVAMRAESDLPAEDRVYCDAYALGVNDYIRTRRNRWGIEYQMIGAIPKPWNCSDSLLALLYMSDFLTSNVEREAQQWLWRQKLSEEWQNFIFARTHPWSEPIIGRKKVPGALLPPIWQFIPASPIKPDEGHASHFRLEDGLVGSNAWVYGGKDVIFLAADPHLQMNVPQIWYANRLRISNDEWVVGSSIAGLPGITIGMNPYLGWTFTNLGDDVDDLLEERLSEDKTQYLAFEEGGRSEWQRIAKKRTSIKVKGAADVVIEAWFTHRGPIIQKPTLGKSFYSRQWMAFRKGSLGLPSVSVNRAKNWNEFNLALNRMISPSQNVLFVDRQGRIGFRSTGQLPKRRISGHIPLPAKDGEWLGVEAPSKRPRILWETKNSKSPRYIINANAEVWEDKFVQRWMPDDRRFRIQELLANLREVNRVNHEVLQLDSQSRFARMLLNWIAEHSTLTNDDALALCKRWRAWDGDSRSDDESFYDADLLEEKLSAILIDRVQNHFFEPDESLPPYEHFLRRAWLTRFLDEPDGSLVFGLEAEELANHLIQTHLSRKNNDPSFLFSHSKANAWNAQHPFVDRIPILGRFFRVTETPQYGCPYCVRAERPKFGPSMRLVIDMLNPLESTWAFPVGQSGHLGSIHYRDQQRNWAAGVERLSLFDKSFEWSFSPRS